MSTKKKPNRKPTPRRRGQTGRPPAETPDWAGDFLEAIRDGLHVKDATEIAGISRTHPYKRRNEDEDFAKAWAEASELGTEALESEAGRRAYHGTLKPVYYKGNEVGQIREYSDTLLMFLLRALNPNKYRDNAKFEHLGKGGAEPPRVVIYLPDNGRSGPDDVANDGDHPRAAEAILAEPVR